MLCNRLTVDFIWEPWEGPWRQWEGGSAKPAEWELRWSRGPATPVPGAGQRDRQGQGPEASVVCPRSWRQANVAGAAGRRNRLTQKEPWGPGRGR